MKRVYLVRHGETILNAAKTHQDHTSLLSPFGIKQAEFVAKRLKDIPLDTIIASPQTRAKHTAEIISTAINLPITYNDDLVETRRPSAVIGYKYDDPYALSIMTEIHENHHLPDYHHSDEENNYDGYTRALSFLKYLDTLDQERILVVTHGEIMRLIIWASIFGETFDPHVYRKFHLHSKTTNTGITILEEDHHGWRLLTWNDYSHLP